MEKPEGLITEEDTVYAVLTKYPQLKEVMLKMSPKYSHLQNPVMFNTVAKVTPLKKAANVSGIYIKEMLYQLNDAIGKGAEFLVYFKSQIPKMQEEFLKKYLNKGADAGKSPRGWISRRILRFLTRGPLMANLLPI